MLVAQDRILLDRLDQARAQTDKFVLDCAFESLYDCFSLFAERHRTSFTAATGSVHLEPLEA